MKPTFTRKATVADALDVAKRLRSADRDELLAAGGMVPELVLPAYVHQGREVYVSGIVALGSPEIIFGVDPIPHLLPTAATIWMLTTDVIYGYPVETAVNSKRWFEEFHERFELLTNFVDARNTRHHKWLKWLGFTPLRRVEKFGAQNLPFIEFASYRPCV